MRERDTSPVSSSARETGCLRDSLISLKLSTNILPQVYTFELDTNMNSFKQCIYKLTGKRTHELVKILRQILLPYSFDDIESPLGFRLYHWSGREGKN